MTLTLGPVWSYWEGPCSPLIELCLTTLARHAQARILDRDGFEALWKFDRDLPIDELYVAHRADFIRAYLLRFHGGVWLDADCLVLRDLSSLLRQMEGKDLGVFRQKVGGIANNFLVARADAPVMVDFYERIVRHLRARRPIHWTEIGTIPLSDAIACHRAVTHEFDRDAIMPICWSEAERCLELHYPGDLNNHSQDEGPYCHMLSNHSLPAELKITPRSELVCGPNLIGAVLRRALSQEDTTMNHASNYVYWRQSGTEWNTEYERRKRRHPYYHIAEMMLLDYVTHHAPCKVLEWGCGTGRHLFNLSQLPNVQVFGFDQSRAMVDAALGFGSPEWCREHIAIGEPTGRLPYADGEFDLVLTSEALLHTRPEDLEGRLRELTRVCKGHVLHMEAPPNWIGGFSAWHDGCWGHDFVAAYAAIGVGCELLPAGFSRQVPYRAAVSSASVRWTWSPAMLAVYRRMDEALEEGFRAAGIAGHA
jgi:SAM-dependent methyltransferase